MTDSLFNLCDAKASQIIRDASGLEAKFELLASLPTFQLRPVASIRLAAKRLRDAADCLDRLADKAPKPAKPELETV